jgi:uncharacterized protein (TIGR02145 family)
MKRLLLTITLLISPILAQCDWNEDGYIDVIDVVSMVDCILFECYDGTQCDWIEDGSLNIIDIVAVIDCILMDCWVEDTSGCTDPLASNYDPNAIIDDGSCDYNNTVTDIDGNVYNTVIIGDQTWMAENLKTTQYNNGDEIPTGYSNGDWESLGTGAYAVYPWDNDNASLATCEGDCDEVYGSLYNFYAIDDDRGICPESWHVPTIDEWYELVNYLGGSGIAGGKMKATGIIGEGDGLWYSPNSGATNESGFTALPGGHRDYPGAYYYLGIVANFWTSTGYSDVNAYGWQVGYSYIESNYLGLSNRHGVSVRCVIDTDSENFNGCTDSDAYNFNPDATIDDGTCEYVSDLFELILVPEGEFTSGLGDTLIYLEYDYEIMKYEVTNTEYKHYLEEALIDDIVWIEENEVKGNYNGDEYYPEGIYSYYYLGAPVEGNNYGKIEYETGEFSITAGYENHPVVDVTYFGAVGMAEYYLLRLPTMREWEKSARGNTGWDLPWGNEDLDGSRLNYWYNGDPWDNGTTPKGFFNGQNYDGFQTIDSPSPYGLYDVVGNVWEWTNERISEGSPNIVVRGGGFTNQNSGLNTWENAHLLPDFHYYHTGFRLVRDFGNIYGCTDSGANNYNSEATNDDGSCEYNDIDGNTYNSVVIGNQRWMTENLKVTHYRNGDEIATGYTNQNWENLTYGAYIIYPWESNIFSISSCEMDCSEIYGNLYNWYAIIDPREISPEGWHVPSDIEIMELEMYLGISPSEVENIGHRGVDEGGKLKEAGYDHWDLPNEGATNESGYTALPGGRYTGYYQDLGHWGYYWSETESYINNNTAWSREVRYSNSLINRGNHSKSDGLSIRCIRDSQ